MDTFTAVLTIATLIFLIANLVIVGYGIHIANRQFNMSTTSNYIERYNSQNMLQSRIMIETFVKSLENMNNEDRDNRIKEVLTSDEKENIELEMNIRHLLNLMTELGVAKRAGVINREVLFTFNAIIPKYWNMLSDYIAMDRELEKPREIYTSFEYLYLYIQQHPFYKNGKPVVKYPFWKKDKIDFG